MIENLAKITVDKEIVGLGNIVISDVDGTIFINNTNQIGNGIKNSLAVYSKDGQELSSAGLKCLWDKETATLYVGNVETESINTPRIRSEDIESKKVKAENVDSEYLRAEHLYVSDYADSLKFTVKKWLGFASENDQSFTPYKIKLFKNPYTEKETLGFLTNDFSKGKSKTSIALDDQKVYFRNTINLNESTIESAIGSSEDRKGDFVYDGDHLYICTKDYDGISKIWKRLKAEEWE